MDSCLARLLTLEGCSGTAEKKLADCEKTAVEFSSQLEGKWAVLGTLPQESRLLHEEPHGQLELLGPAASPWQQGGGPQEWAKLEDWQKRLDKHVMGAAMRCSFPWVFL